MNSFNSKRRDLLRVGSLGVAGAAIPAVSLAAAKAGDEPATRSGSAPGLGVFFNVRNYGATGDGKTDLAKDMALSLKDWSDPKTLADKPDQELFNMIRNGKGQMPPEADGRAKDEEVWNIIIYIRNLYKLPPVPAPAPAAAPADTPAPPPSN